MSIMFIYLYDNVNGAAATDLLDCFLRGRRFFVRMYIMFIYIYILNTWMYIY